MSTNSYTLQFRILRPISVYTLEIYFKLCLFLFPKISLDFLNGSLLDLSIL